MTTEKKVDGWIDDLVGALCDPIIVYPLPGKTTCRTGSSRRLPLSGS